MPNDVSYFKVPGDSNTYAFNDANSESGLAAETARAEAAEQANASAIAAETTRATTAEQTNAENIGTLSNLTTTEQGSLVGAVNEVDADVNTLIENTGGRAILVGQTSGSSVTFSAPFSATPYVLVSPRNTSAGTVIAVKVTGASATGFTVECKYWSPSSGAWADSSSSYNWIAIGMP